MNTLHIISLCCSSCLVGINVAEGFFKASYQWGGHRQAFALAAMWLGLTVIDAVLL